MEIAAAPYGRLAMTVLVGGQSKSPALWRGAFFTAAGLGRRRAKLFRAQQWTPLRITAPTSVGDSESDETAKLQLEG